MDQTVDILGLIDDTVGYSKNEESENNSNTLLESNLVFEASKKEVGINGFKSKASDDKKPLVYDATIQRSSLFTTVPQTKMEFLRFFGIILAAIVSIVLLYLIFDTKSKVIEVGCKIKKANEEISNLTIALENQSNANSGMIEVSGTCSGTYDNKQKEIITPNYPNDYAASKTCYWNINAPSGKRVELQFVAFKLESSSNCRYDYLEIYDGGSSSSSKIGSKLCGSTRPSNKVSSGNRLYLKWRSDDSEHHSGFKISCKSK